MTIKGWSQLLFDYYFEENDCVFLSIDKRTLIESAINSGRFNKAFNRFANKPNFSKTDYVWEDFRRCFYQKDPETINYSASKGIFLRLFDKEIGNFVDSINNSDEKYVPTVLPFITLMVMPFSEKIELGAKDFYQRVSEFLRENFIFRSKKHNDKEDEKLSSTDFAGLRHSLDLMWSCLAQWSVNIGLQYRPKIKTYSSTSTYKYVRPFMAECLLNSTQRQLLFKLFYKIGLAPFASIPFTDEEIIRLIKDNKNSINISDDTWNKIIKDDYKDVLVEEFYRAYSRWNGTTISKNKTNNTVKQSDSGTIHSLILQMQRTLSGYELYLTLYAPQVNSGKIVALSRNNNTTNVSISFEGYSVQKISNTREILNALSNEQTIEYIEGDTSENTKAVFKPRDFYLFSKSRGAFTSQSKAAKGMSYMVMVKESNNNYRNWLDDNRAVEIRAFNNSGFKLYKIENLQTSFDGNTALKIETRKNCTLKHTCGWYVDSGEKALLNIFDAYFEITGVDKQSDIIKAVYYDNNDSIIGDSKLSYDDNRQLFVVKHDGQYSQCRFAIFCNETKLSRVNYRFAKVPYFKGENYKEIRYNKWGIYDPEGEFSGLKLPNVVNGDQAFCNMRELKNNMNLIYHEPNFQTVNYRSEDFLLYILSANANNFLSKQDFLEAIQVLVENEIIKEDDNITNDENKKFVFTTIVNNYSRLGYINYCYAKNNKEVQGAHIISVNKPTLVMLPPKYRIIENGLRGETLQSDESWFKFLLTGARTPELVSEIEQTITNKYSDTIKMQIKDAVSPLYPQSIIIWSCDKDNITSFANEIGLELQFCIYSNSLLHRLGDLNGYIEGLSISSVYYDNVSAFDCIDYANLPAINRGLFYAYPKKSQLYVCPKKSQLDPKGDVVSYWPNTYSEENIYWKDGRQYAVEKYWSYFIGMSLFKNNVLTNDNDGSLIAPYKFRLPILYDRALTLITGEMPKAENGLRIYPLYKNPFVKNITVKNIMNKLS